MKKILILIFFQLLSYILFAQTDTNNYVLVEYNNNFKFEDGIYLNFEQAKNNKPIPKVKIISSLDNKDFNFFDNLLKEDKILIYNEAGIEQIIETNDIWGYSNNGTIFINKGVSFCRIGIMGTICHFVAIEEVANTSSPYGYEYSDFSTYPNTSNSTIMVQYLLNFRTGEIYDFNYKSVEILLMDAPSLYDEFINLSRNKRKNFAFVYVRKYNDLNPLYIPTW